MRSDLASGSTLSSRLRRGLGRTRGKRLVSGDMGADLTPRPVLMWSAAVHLMLRVFRRAFALHLVPPEGLRL